MSIMTRSDDAMWAENELSQLKEEVELLKEELNDTQHKVSSRDLSNGQLLAKVSEMQEENDRLEEKFRMASNEHDNKSMSNLDLTRKVRTLEMEKTALEAQVGRLMNEAAATWQEGMTQAMRKIAREEVCGGSEDIS